jgi:AcrR family transcriptional regulator
MKNKDLKHEIIKAAYKAFAKASYRKVSTNDIVDEAGVSKGLLFHYFKNKKSLYLTLYEMAWLIIHKDIFEDFPYEEQDVFERLKYLILRKSQAMQEHKTLTSFIKQVHMNDDKEIAKKRSGMYHAFQQKNYKRVFENIDTSLFKRPDYHDEIFKVVTWTFNKLTHDWEKQHAHKETHEAITILEEELCHYTRFFKQYFYN